MTNSTTQRERTSPNFEMEYRGAHQMDSFLVQELSDDEAKIRRALVGDLTNYRADIYTHLDEFASRYALLDCDFEAGKECRDVIQASLFVFPEENYHEQRNWLKEHYLSVKTFLEQERVFALFDWLIQEMQVMKSSEVMVTREYPEEFLTWSEGLKQRIKHYMLFVTPTLEETVPWKFTFPSME